MKKISTNDNAPYRDVKKAIQQLCQLFLPGEALKPPLNMACKQFFSRLAENRITLADMELCIEGTVSDTLALAKITAISKELPTEALDAASLSFGEGAALEVIASGFVNTEAYTSFTSDTFNSDQSFASFDEAVPQRSIGAVSRNDMSPWEMSQKMAFINSQNLLGKGVK